MKRFTATIIVLGALGLAGGAHADSAPRMHDGFHFQAQLGLGYYSVSADIPGGGDSGISGVTIPITVLLGGTVIPGLVIGGGIMADYAPSPSFEQNGQSVTVDGVSQYIIGIGAYADYYLDPAKGGLHFQAYFGWGGLETSSNGNAGGSDPTGLVTYVGGGYDFWIADQWSAGVMGRLTYGPFSQNDVGFTTISPAVVGTITWH